MSQPACKPSIGKCQAEDMLVQITSPVPTRYKMVEESHGSPIHVYCALDTLEYALISHGTYEVVGESPVGQAVQFTLTPKGPEPAVAWMSTVTPANTVKLPSAGSAPSRCCPYTHFFASKDSYQSWRNELPEHIRPLVECLPLPEAWTRARRALAMCQTEGTCECR